MRDQRKKLLWQLADAVQELSKVQALIAEMPPHTAERSRIGLQTIGQLNTVKRIEKQLKAINSER